MINNKTYWKDFFFVWYPVKYFGTDGWISQCARHHCECIDGSCVLPKWRGKYAMDYFHPWVAILHLVSFAVHSNHFLRLAVYFSLYCFVNNSDGPWQKQGN